MNKFSYKNKARYSEYRIKSIPQTMLKTLKTLRSVLESFFQNSHCHNLFQTHGKNMMHGEVLGL